LGGDYWRQIIFYSILLENHIIYNKPMNYGLMDFFEGNSSVKAEEKKVIVDELSKAIVSDQMKTVYQKIKNAEFTPGCGDEKCKWCMFVNDHIPIDTVEPDGEVAEIEVLGIDS
jgi:DNA helicase II / ATP-dependent DNA helicase PcrA